MTLQAQTRYSTAVFSYTPPDAVSGDPQSVQSALSSIINRIRVDIERRTRASSDILVQTPPAIKTARWYTQIRSLRLAQASGVGAPTRSMYMVRNSSDSETVTLVIEDSAHAAVNLSTVAAGAFDHLLSTTLLPAAGSKQAEHHQHQQGPQNPAQQQDRGQPQQAQQGQMGRWLPRPSYLQIEGVSLSDTAADFDISIGMLSARGGASGAGLSVSNSLVIMLEYHPIPFLPAASYYMLTEYLSHLLPETGTLRDISNDTTSLDWRSLLGVNPHDAEAKLPTWSARNTGWCLVKICKDVKLI